MEKNVKVCDLCNSVSQKLATAKCEFCEKDICDEHAFSGGLFVDIYGQNILLQYTSRPYPTKRMCSYCHNLLTKAGKSLEFDESELEIIIPLINKFTEAVRREIVINRIEREEKNGKNN